QFLGSLQAYGGRGGTDHSGYVLSGGAGTVFVQNITVPGSYFSWLFVNNNRSSTPYGEIFPLDLTVVPAVNTGSSSTYTTPEGFVFTTSTPPLYSYPYYLQLSNLV